MKSILDPKFKYTPSHSTDIRKTFERIQNEWAMLVHDINEAYRQAVLEDHDRRHNNMETES